MIVRGFEMEKGIDYVDNFSPTPGLAVARLMMSLAVANDMELHKIDIEQAFLQADKLDEGVNGRYFINPPPGSPEAGNKNIVYEVLRPLYGSPSSPRALHKTMDAYFKSEGFDTIGFEESVWVRPAGGKYSEDIYVSAHVDDCLLSCKSLTVMAKFKAHMLERFVGGLLYFRVWGVGVQRRAPRSASGDAAPQRSATVGAVAGFFWLPAFFSCLLFFSCLFFSPLRGGGWRREGGSRCRCELACVEYNTRFRV